MEAVIVDDGVVVHHSTILYTDWLEAKKMVEEKTI